MDSTWLKRFREAQCDLERETFTVGTAPLNDCQCGKKCHGERCVDCITKELNSLRSPHYRKAQDQNE